jgi:hypothetical protein
VLRLLTPVPTPDQQDNPPPGDAGDDAIPRDGSQPGADAGTPNGNGQGTPQSGSGADSGQFSDPRALERRLSEIDRQVQSILAESDGQPGPSDALRILELLAERSSIAAQRGAFSGSTNPNDY